jgi:hypothetical protein
VVISEADKYSELTYNKEHEENEHSHRETHPGNTSSEKSTVTNKRTWPRS